LQGWHRLGFWLHEANKSSGITWNETSGSRTKAPGSKMMFASIKSEKELSDLRSYASPFDEQGYPRQK
jgi:cytochrome c